MSNRGVPVTTLEEDERDDMDADNNDDSNDEQDDGPDEADDGETEDESNQPDNSEIEKFTRASATETGKPADVHTAEGKKRERSNAKAVECLDLDGNVIEVFRSGMAASMKLNIPQGDISLCCRGMKPSVMGFKFRFSGETEERQAQRLKKGFVLDFGGFDQGKVELTRTTRASRGEYGQGNRHADIGSRSILDPPELKARLWKQETVKVGPLLIKKWLPNVAEPTAALQDRIPKNATEARLKLSKRRRTLNRLSIGSTLAHKPTYDEAV